jgi:hypothetical protein
LGEDIIYKILLFYDNINPEWLLTGKGSMLREKTDKSVNQHSVTPDIPSPFCSNYIRLERHMEDLRTTILVQREFIEELKKVADNARLADITVCAAT